jgi:hypothetical protein
MYRSQSFQTLTKLSLNMFRTDVEVLKQFRRDLKIDPVRKDLFIYLIRLMRKGTSRMSSQMTCPIRFGIGQKKNEYSIGNLKSKTTTT